MSIEDIKDRTPNEDTIELLESLLEQAKDGDLRSIFYIFGSANDGVNHGWSLDGRNSDRKILAEMVMAQHDFVVNIEFTEQDSVLVDALNEE